MIKVLHIQSGETALCREAEAGNVLLQFDRMDHPHSHGWFLCRADSVRPVPDEPLPASRVRRAEELYPGPEVGGPMHNVLRRG